MGYQVKLQPIAPMVALTTLRSTVVDDSQDAAFQALVDALVRILTFPSLILGPNTQVVAVDIAGNFPTDEDPSGTLTVTVTAAGQTGAP